MLFSPTINVVLLTYSTGFRRSHKAVDPLAEFLNLEPADRYIFKIIKQFSSITKQNSVDNFFDKNTSYRNESSLKNDLFVVH